MTVNAIVLSMQWGPEGEPEAARQGNALQVSFRPGVALQSTLYQLCQQVARMFHQQRFSGRMALGLTLGFDPAAHGRGDSALLDGFDPTARALVVSDARHCGFAWDPNRTAEELLGILRGNLPIGARDANVHSLQAISTMPSVFSFSMPNPVAAGGERPPAVAGKFYPAEDAARRALVDSFLERDAAPASSGTPLAIMVPHAGLKYSGAIAAKTWRTVEGLDGRTLVIISPKHTHDGVNWSVCPFDAWRLSSTTRLDGDVDLARRLAERIDPLRLDAAAHQQEHGIEVQLPLLERLAPHAKIVGLALLGGSWSDIRQAATQLAEVLKELPEPPLLVISSDMNHYAPDRENRRRDRLALDALATGDPERLIEACREHEISMCGVIPAALVLETLRQLGHDFRVVEIDYATSGDVTGDRSQVVGYAGVVLEARG